MLMDDRRTALVVDDDELVRRSIADILEFLDLRTLSASGSADALALLNGIPRWDLLITDISLRGEEGWTVAEKVRANSPGTAIIYVTGHHHLDEGRPLPRSLILTKPFTVDRLEEAVGHAVSFLEIS